jgi:calcium channel MID1
MLFPKFTALQSRFAASFAASLVLLLLYLAFSNPHLAYAANADSIAHEDHNHPRLLELLHQSEPFDASSSENGLEGENYTPEFAGIDRSIIGRAEATIQELGNNAPGKSNINGGQTQYWTFPNKTIWGPFSPQTPGLPSNISKRDAQVVQPTENINDEEKVVELAKRQNSATNTRRIYLSVNTCDQPHANEPNPNVAPPPLELYISKKPTNQKPDKNTNDGVVPIDGGCGEAIFDATSNVWFSVSAPQSSSFGGNYNYELTASIDALYASCNDTSSFNFKVIDSDTTSALLYSSIFSNPNTSDPVYQVESQAWMNGPPRFSVYAYNQDDPTVLGLHRSVCGLKNHAQIQGNLQGKNASNVDTDMTKRGDGFPKQEFFLKNLNGTSAYYAIIGIDGNSTSSGGGVVGGGGTVWNPVNFTTKSGML